MTGSEVIQKLKQAPNRRVVAADTKLPYGYLCKVVSGDIKNPGSKQMDVLRRYFQDRSPE